MVHAMTPYTTPDPPLGDRWDAFLAEHPKGSIFHTPEMHEVHRRTRREAPLTLAALDPDGAVAALVSAVRVHTLSPVLGPLGSRSVLYAEPLCRPGAGEALAGLLREHDRRLGRRVVFTEVRALGPPGDERAPLEDAGYAFEPYLNFLVDLRRSEDEIWGGFTQSLRRAVRRSVKAGVTIAEATNAEGVELLYGLCQDVYRRSRIPLAHRSLFEAALDILAPRRMARIFVARLDGRAVGAHMVLLHKDQAVAWYWANVRTRGLFVQEQLIWHSLRDAAAAGYAVFDMGGAGWPDRPYGVRDFKRKFGGEEVCYGRYRRVYSPRRLALAEGAYDLVRTRAEPFARVVFGTGRRSPDAAEDARPGRAED